MSRLDPHRHLVDLIMSRHARLGKSWPLTLRNDPRGNECSDEFYLIIVQICCSTIIFIMLKLWSCLYRPCKDKRLLIIKIIIALFVFLLTSNFYLIKYLFIMNIIIIWECTINFLRNFPPTLHGNYLKYLCL